MHLFELTEIQRATVGESVPEWVLGCFRRRSISFFSGEVDETTEVLWLQSRGLCADFRRVPGRSQPSSAPTPGALSLGELLELAEVEAGLARTRWDGRLMYWSDWVSFQTHAKWPEPGRLERVGNCMIEFAPSGAYVEDWRFEPCAHGRLIGLSLLEEKDLDTETVRHRKGGLIICGQHAAFVRGRPVELPAGARLADHLRAHANDAESLRSVFAFDAAYGRATSASEDFKITLATSPWREGESLLHMDGFSYDSKRDLIVQRLEEQGHRIERRFGIDTLQPEFDASQATAASPETRAWFDRERGTLPLTRADALRPLRLSPLATK